MPMNTLEHRVSWPPTQLRILHADLHDDTIDEEDLDHDPFSYFLTKSEDNDDQLMDIDLSAGIECRAGHDTASEPMQIASPSSLPSSPLSLNDDSDNAILSSDDDEEEETYYEGLDTEFGVPFIRKDFSAAGRLKRTFPRGSESTNHGLEVIRPPNRRRLGRTRSLPTQRRRSWREPTSDVWSIPEETASDLEETASIYPSRPRSNAFSHSLPTSRSGLENDSDQLSLRPIPPKRRKSVRWADPYVSGDSRSQHEKTD